MGLKRFMKRSTALAATGAGLAAWAMMPRNKESRRVARACDMPDVYYAHRGLHDAGSGLTKGYAQTSGGYVALARTLADKAGFGSADSPFPIAPENSLAAFAAACEAGYGIELDIQLTADGEVVVVHDADLRRVAGDPRRIEDLTYDELRSIPLFPDPAKPGDSKVNVEKEAGTVSGMESEGSHEVDSSKESADFQGAGTFQHVPLFSEVLDLVAGRVPIIVEYKIHHEDWWTYEEELMAKGDALLEAYEGAYAIESFNPMVLRWYRQHRPEVCRGQLAVDSDFKQDLKQRRMKRWFAGKLLFDFVGRPDFVAYEWHGGTRFQLRTAGEFGAMPVSWTIRSADELAEASRSFDRHIFESFVPQD